MFDIGLSELTLALLASGEVGSFPGVGTWRLNDALLAVDATARRAGILDLWHRSVQDVVGYAPAVVDANGDTVDHAVNRMLASQLLQRDGGGVGTYLVVTEAATSAGRRVLFGLDPVDAAVVYDAGRILSSRLAMSANNFASAVPSSTVRSPMPAMRLQLVPGR